VNKALKANFLKKKAFKLQFAQHKANFQESIPTRGAGTISLFAVPSRQAT
jgi:hypothetical protein